MDGVSLLPHSGESKPHGSVNQDNVCKIVAVTAPGKPPITLVYILTRTNIYRRRKTEARLLTNNNT
jgi:hypothetical protein